MPEPWRVLEDGDVDPGYEQDGESEHDDAEAGRGDHADEADDADDADAGSGNDGEDGTHGSDGRGVKGLPGYVYERHLAHPTRQAVVDVLREEPGLNRSQVYRRVEEELDETPGDLRYHLDYLVDEGLVVTYSERERKEVHCFLVVDASLWRDDRTHVLFGRAPSRNVALFLVDNPGATTEEIADALGLEPSTIRYHLQRLHKRGLIRKHKVGATWVYGPSEILEQWTHDVGGSFPRPWGE